MLCIRCVYACVYKHSQLSLQAEGLLQVVVATAEVDEDGVSAGGHLVLVLLLHLKSPLQVLIGHDGNKQTESGV